MEKYVKQYQNNIEMREKNCFIVSELPQTSNTVTGKSNATPVFTILRLNG